MSQIESKKVIEHIRDVLKDKSTKNLIRKQVITNKNPRSGKNIRKTIDIDSERGYNIITIREIPKTRQGETKMWKYTKTFFGRNRANEFAKQVNGQVWSGKDAFNQTIYIVKWN